MLVAPFEGGFPGSVAWHGATGLADLAVARERGGEHGFAAAAHAMDADAGIRTGDDLRRLELHEHEHERLRAMLAALEETKRKNLRQ